MGLELAKFGGLSNVEAKARLDRHGPNVVPEKPGPTLFARFIQQFQSPLIYILLFALIVDAFIWFLEGAVGVPFESIAIAVILILNAGLGMYQEGKSEAALTRLKAMAAPLAWAIRAGHLVHIPAAELVPGDVVRLEAGDRVPADGNLVSDGTVSLDESILTGESVPVERSEGDEVQSGTLLVRGTAFFRVSRTGNESATGRLAVMIGEIEAGKTPLEERLDGFARQIAKIVLLLAVLIVVGGLMIEGTARLGHVLIFAVALAVAAIPEGLPAVLTLTLALGVERMAKRKAVVRRLSAVEALGSVTVIASDKTGTLTENKMVVKGIDAADAESVLQAMTLANDAEPGGEIGDPLELALLAYAADQGIDADELRARFPRTSSIPFDSSYKFMQVSVSEGGRTVSFLKGAPEVLLAKSSLSAADKADWQARTERFAAEGFRVLAFGRGSDDSDGSIEFLGVAKLWDPPRPEVPGAIKNALDAGIRVMMATGDHPATAKAIAENIGIPVTGVLTGAEIESLSDDDLRKVATTTSIFARVNPEHKLRLVSALKSNGEIVAMTGDGVNDAPALKRADVGVAMGNRGSDVTREVADLVLLDDNFATIVTAIEEGRNIYENIQKFIRFLFSTNFALVLLVVGGAFGSFLLGLTDEMGGLLLPLTAVQLLWINIIADGPPALALGLDRDHGVMRQRPRDPSEPLLDRVSVRFIVWTGFFKALMGGLLLVMMPKWGYSLLATRTGVFVFESIAQLVMAYPSRRISFAPERNNVLHLAVAAGVVLQVATIYLPPLRRMLGLEWLDPAAVGIIGAAIVVTWLAAEFFVAADRRLALRAR